MHRTLTGMFILLVILYLLFTATGTRLSCLFTQDGLTSICKNKQWVIYTAIAITMFASYSMYIGAHTECSRENFVSSDNVGKEKPSTVSDAGPLAFSVFYNKVMNVPEDRSQFEVLKTIINGIPYYLVIDEMFKYQMPYHHQLFQNIDDMSYAFMCSSDKINFTCPLLIREDVLKTDYSYYYQRIVRETVERIKNSGSFSMVGIHQNKTDVENVLGKSIYPRYIHHMKIVQSPRTYNQGTAYIIEGLVKSQTTDIFNTMYQKGHALSGLRSFSPYTTVRTKKIYDRTLNEFNDVDILDDKKFMCTTQDQLTTNEDIFFETLPLEKMRLSVPENYASNTLYGLNGSHIHKTGLMSNLYIINNRNDKKEKFYLAWLRDYTDPSIDPKDTSVDKNTTVYDEISPRIIPVGLIPERYYECVTAEDGTNKCGHDSHHTDGVDYSDARLLQVEIIAVNLSPL